MPCCTIVQLKSIFTVALDIDILQPLVSGVCLFYFFFAVLYAYRLIFVRKSEEVSPFLSEMGNCLLELLDCALSVIQGNHNDFGSLGCLGSDSFFGGTNSLAASLRSFICCPIFMKWRDQNDLDVFLYGSVVQSVEKLLKALAKLYKEYSERAKNFHSEMILQDLSSSDISVQNSFPSDSNKSRIMDLDLDVNEDSRDVDILTVGGKIATGISFSSEKWKLGMISVISRFFSVLHAVTWDTLFELMGKESDRKVCSTHAYKFVYNFFFL
jgi:ataxia telangiectasia mutated family protein